MAGETQENSGEPAITRRGIMIGAAGLMTVALGAQWTAKAEAQAMNSTQKVVRNGRINQTVCLWCYDGMSSADMAPVAARLGLKGIDLLTPQQWGPLKEHGLICTMTSGACSIDVGINRKENHGPIVEKLRNLILANADAGYPNVIVFSGNRHLRVRNAVGGIELTSPISDEEGLKNCADAIKEVIGLAEEKKITVCMELLNSKVNHIDYMCDHMEWGVRLCKEVGSERFKLLYDIYHMQIMEGDIIRTLQQNIQYIAHIHTGGVPGRHEIDQTQELYWPAIMRALIDLKFTGFVGQEFIPANADKIASLAAGVKLCDV